MNQLPKIYCACDVSALDAAIALCDEIKDLPIGIKLGLEFFMAEGAAGVGVIRDRYPDTSIFLDLKFHDIPNTVHKAIKSIAHLGVDYTNLHASGGAEMMQRGLDALEGSDTKLLAVTVLTALNEDNIASVGQIGPIATQVERLAKLTQAAGLAGVVCSAHEIETLRRICDPGFTLMTPGIRPAGNAAEDQKRVMTPDMALDKGANHLVIGRPITKASNPRQAAIDILESL